MECNKDEAARAMEIAGKKLAEKDFAAAKKFALKAQNLYPELEGLDHLQATLAVYISAERRINEEADWYGILGVDPLADDDMIRKHYRRLALILHPDKNKSAGAEGAFKMLSEAWSLLSDKAKRTAYDRTRNPRATDLNFPTTNPSVPGGNKSFHDASSNNLNARAQTSATRPAPASALPRHPSQHSTFWTECNKCKMQFEYFRHYLSQTLLCPNCREAFLAVEIPATPPNQATPWVSYQQQQTNRRTMNRDSNTRGKQPASAPNVRSAVVSGGSSHHVNSQSGPFSKSYGIGNMPASPSSAAQAAPSSATQAAHVQPPSEKLKKGREEAETATLKEEALRKKVHAPKSAGINLARSFLGGDSSSVHKEDKPMNKRCIDGREMPNQMAARNKRVGLGIALGSQKGNSETARLNASASIRPNNRREFSLLGTRSMLTKRAKLEIDNKTNDWRKEAVSKPSDKSKASEKKEREEKETPKAAAIGVKTNAKKYGGSVDAKNKVQMEKSSPAISDVDTDTKGTALMSMSVPDPDFHDFDRDRTEKSFGDNQVWAAYDDDDGMPRYYAMIHNVISVKPFKMQISWLNSKSNNELAPINWVGHGFSKTSGEFRIGKHEVNKSLNSFSHQVKWMKGTRGVIQIYPRKGDVWALYRNWSPDWNELTTDEVIHKYDMVEVLEDYDEKRGVAVVPLVKVSGFKTVFHQHLNPREVRIFPKEELFRFSHQVPSYVLTGQEAQNAPRGCREIDPAAAPLELLQVITEEKEEEMLEAAEKDKEDLLESENKIEKEEPLETAKISKPEGIMKDARKVEVEGMVMKGKENKKGEMVDETKEPKKETRLDGQ